MTTKQDIRNNALRLAEQADDYNTPDGNVVSHADNLLAAIHEEWIADSLVDWELDDIPVRVELAVTDILGYRLAQRNRKVTPKKLIVLRDSALQGQATLERQREIPSSGQPVKADYF
ncbi:hypothetical protein [uncultured Paraglaciecola sp.]|uniref:hypothetical protein n=1 Tax=uncultured Paraglaciecola sp. TaxID=1765024 RepID=UPI0026288C93|nr:hypothetical protein [uncultured Paraglaciecola sp.]